MAGKCAGAASRISQQYPKAPYVHCIPWVFFNSSNNSPTKNAFLIAKLKSIVPKARHTHLINVCRTRRVARIDGVDIFAQVFTAIAHCLEAIKLNEDRSWNADASVNNKEGWTNFLLHYPGMTSELIDNKLIGDSSTLPGKSIAPKAHRNKGQGYKLGKEGYVRNVLVKPNIQKGDTACSW
eukprot:gene922-229_t